MENENIENENLEELDDNIIVLTDDEGNDNEFEFIDLIEMDEKEYIVLLPIDEEDKDDGEVVILRVEVNGEDESYVSVDSEEEGNKVFELFKDKFKDEFQFDD